MGTPLGEIATMDTECADHIAFLVAEVKRAVYSSDQITMPQDAVVLDVGANIGLFTREALRHGAKRDISVDFMPGNQACFACVAPDIASGRVSVVASGAWDVRDTLSFLVDTKRPGRSSCVDENSARESTHFPLKLRQSTKLLRSCPYHVLISLRWTSKERN